MNKVINIKNTYLLLIIVFGLIGLSLYSTYALFSDSLETEEIVNISAINLEIGIEDFKTYNQIELNPHEKKSILIKLSNSFDKLNYYKLWYEMVNPNSKNDLIKVAKSFKSLNNSYGTINSGNILEIELNIINYTSNNVVINLGVDYSSENNIKLSDNKYDILDVYEDASSISWSLENNDFVLGKCSRFTLGDKPSGVYKLELINSNNNYVSGSLYLDNTMDLYVCLDNNSDSNNSFISYSKPNKDWAYSDDLYNKLLFLSKDNTFALNKASFNDLSLYNDNYSYDDVKKYFLSNISFENKNSFELNNSVNAKITLLLPKEDINKEIVVDKIYIDSKLSNYPTSGEYYLTDYDCNNITSNLYWDNNDYSVKSSNNISDTCDIYLSSSNRLLSSSKQGDYVNYTPEKNVSNINTCGNEVYNNSLYRIAYINNTTGELIPYLVSGGISECSDSINIDNINKLSINYCNSDLIYNNNCDINNGTVNTWMFNTTDFERILLGSSYLECNNLNYIDSYCGYNSDLINIMGSYRIINGSSIVNFNSLYNGLNDIDNSLYGFRVVIKLDPNVKIISGLGTKDDPYNICNNNCE